MAVKLTEAQCLLSRVMSERARNRTTMNALVDWLQEHLPADGQTTEVIVTKRIREGRIWITRQGDRYEIVTEYCMGDESESTYHIGSHAPIDHPELGRVICGGLFVFQHDRA